MCRPVLPSTALAATQAYRSPTPMLSSTKLHVLGNASDPLPDYVAGFVEHLRLRMS